MAGFGFLRQMADTFKYNRDLFEKPKRKSFGKGNFKASKTSTLSTGQELTHTERQKFIKKAVEINRGETRRRLMVIFLTVLIVTIIYFGFIPLVEFILNLDI